MRASALQCIVRVGRTLLSVAFNVALAPLEHHRRKHNGRRAALRAPCRERSRMGRVNPTPAHNPRHSEQGRRPGEEPAVDPASAAASRAKTKTARERLTVKLIHVTKAALGVKVDP